MLFNGSWIKALSKERQKSQEGTVEKQKQPLKKKKDIFYPFSSPSNKPHETSQLFSYHLRHHAE